MPSVNAPQMSMKRACFLLAVDEKSDIALIKQSYRRAAKLYHPDTNSGLSDPHMFNNIVLAYNFIIKERENGALSAQSVSKTKGKRYAAKKNRLIKRWMEISGKAWSGFVSVITLRRARLFLRSVSFRSKGSKVSQPLNKEPEAEFLDTDPFRLLTFEELAIRFDKSPNIWVRVETAHAIYINFHNHFEPFAIPRLEQASEKAKVELIRILGRIGTHSALIAIAPYLTSKNLNVCCSTFMALDNAGEAGQAIIDNRLKTQSAFTYHIIGVFNKSKLEKQALKAKLVSSINLRRLKAVMAQTEATLSDLLEGIGASVS